MQHPVYPYGNNHSEAMMKDLSALAYEYRLKVLEIVYKHQAGQIGGAFSIAEVLVALYFHHLSLDPENPKWRERDRLIFSKGHACPMLYTCLANRGFFPLEWLDTFRELNSNPQGHPEPVKTPGVEVAAGPLDHGIAIRAVLGPSSRKPLQRWVRPA